MIATIKSWFKPKEEGLSEHQKAVFLFWDEAYKAQQAAMDMSHREKACKKRIENKKRKTVSKRPI